MGIPQNRETRIAELALCHLDCKTSQFPGGKRCDQPRGALHLCAFFYVTLRIVFLFLPVPATLGIPRF